MVFKTRHGDCDRTVDALLFLDFKFVVVEGRSIVYFNVDGSLIGAAVVGGTVDEGVVMIVVEDVGVVVEFNGILFVH